MARNLVSVNGSDYGGIPKIVGPDFFCVMSATIAIGGGTVRERVRTATTILLQSSRSPALGSGKGLRQLVGTNAVSLVPAGGIEPTA